jgi:hypothetical protein
MKTALVEFFVAMRNPMGHSLRLLYHDSILYDQNQNADSALWHTAQMQMNK